jgi:uncharacterized membrane protein YeiB/predicted alpha/beta superfamily hydrolase
MEGTEAPVPRLERSAGIDFARGMALLGIILVNARFFFLPMGCALGDGPLPQGLVRSTLDLAVHDAVDALATFKFISIFSLLFGFGLAQQAARAAAAGRSRWPNALRRLGLMLAIGAVHGIFIWYGDILTTYALLGVLAVACIGLDDRWLRRVTIGVLSLVVLITVVGAALQWALAGIEPPAAAPEAAADMAAESPRGIDAMLAAEFNVGSQAWIEAETSAFRTGPWHEALLFRVVGYLFGTLAAPFSYGWQSLMMMLLGVWAQRSGLFAAAASGRRRRLASRLILAGLPFAALAVLPWWLLGRESGAATALTTVGVAASAVLLPVGYACLAVEFGPRLPAVLRAPVQAAGSIGLTVYLGESIACTAIASWWGLAMFGTMGDARFTMVAMGVWAGLAIAALAWTTFVGNGPMERLWRWGTYGSMRQLPSTALPLLALALSVLPACNPRPTGPSVAAEAVGEPIAIEPLPGVAVEPKAGITGSVRIHADVPSSDASIRARNVVVWLPPGYADAAAATQRYPVLYMHDGQNAFDPATAFLGREWHADEVADRLVREGRIPPLIIVGIWNTPDRVADYTPDQDPDEHRGDRKPQGRGGNGKAYLAWIATELKPMIDRAYRTRPERTSTAMMGSSLGGIISLAAAEERPETFGRIAAVSPSLWWNGGSVIDRWSARPPAPDRLWICMGDRERAGLDAELRRFEQAIRAADPGLAERMHAEVVAGGTHDEPSWSARLDRILEYLLAERASGAEATKDSRPRR